MTPARLKGVHFVGHAGLQRLGVAAHEAPRRKESRARLGRQRRRLAHRVRDEVGLRHEGVDEAERMGLLAVERLGEQEEFRRPARPKRCGARSDDPASGTRPRLTNGIWKRDSGVA